MSDKPIDAVVVPEEKDVELITTDEKEVDMSMANVEHLEKIAEGIDRFVTAHKKITMAVLKLAKPGDWVKFKSGEQEVGCLNGAGAERIAAPMGISFINWSKEKKTGKDEQGDFYWWWYTCTAKLGSREIQVEGRAGSRDKLFGKKEGKWKVLSDINEGDLQTAARHNCMKEGVKVLLGIRNMPVDELTAAGIKLIDGGVEFKQKESTPEDKEKQIELGNVIMKLTENDKGKAEGLLETLTTWTNAEKKIVKGKRHCADITGKQLTITLSKAKQMLSDKEKANV